MSPADENDADGDAAPGRRRLNLPRVSVSYGQGVAGLGLTFAAAVAAFALLGVWLDGRFDSSPWATLGLTLFGIFSGMAWLIIKANAMARPAPGPRRDARDDSTGPSN